MVLLIKILSVFLISTQPDRVYQEPELEFFSLSMEEVNSEGSIVFYSDSESNIDSDKLLAIEGWNYDVQNREYKYFCYIKIGDTVIKLETNNKSQGEKKSETVFKKDDLTITVKTEYLRAFGTESQESESYLVNGTLTIVSGGVSKTLEVIGLVAV